MQQQAAELELELSDDSVEEDKEEVPEPTNPAMRP